MIEERSEKRPAKRPIVKIDNFVRKHTSAIDVETLHQKGVTKINYLTLSKVNELVALAVAKAFEKYRRTFTAQDATRLEREVRAELMAELDEYRRGPTPPGRSGGTGGEEAAAADPARTELLERRIAKLRAQLAETERALGELEAGEAGIPSIYKSVQGLDPEDTEYETKIALLTTVFKDNLRLRCRSTSDTQTAT